MLKSIGLLALSIILVIAVFRIPIPVLVEIKSPVAVEKILVVEKVNVTQLVVGEGLLGNITLGWIEGPRIGYVRLIALDVYDNGVWRLNDSNVLEDILVRAKTIHSAPTSAKYAGRVTFHLETIDTLPTVKPSYKVILVPQPRIYRRLDDIIRVDAPLALKDPYERFIALRTLFIYNNTYSVYMIIPSNNTFYYTLPFPHTPPASRPMSIVDNLDAILATVKVGEVAIDTPHNESTARVKDLALRLLREYLDKPLGVFLADVIGFIRSNTTYSALPPRTPPGMDLVDYFLYESHTGSCLHYASSLAVLLRDMGIRARVVLGYIVEEEKDRQVIRGIPHLWVEVYIPGRGWLQVDPTPPIASSEPSLSVIQGVDERVSEYVNISIERALREYRESMINASVERERPVRLSPYEPIEINGTNTSTSNRSIPYLPVPSNEVLVSIGLVSSIVLVIGLMEKVTVITRRDKSLAKEMLAEITGKLGVSIDIEHSTPREVVESLLEIVPEDIGYELKKFLAYYERASYGGKGGDLSKALKILSRIHRLLGS